MLCCRCCAVNACCECRAVHVVLDSCRADEARAGGGDDGLVAAMTDWWRDLDDEIVNCFVDQESLTPGELSQKIGMSTEAVTSLLGRLAQEGRITILRVARTSD